jgi:hypothetical protein
MAVIPADAEDVFVEATTNGEQHCACVLHGRIVGYRLRDAAGRLVIERAVKDGVRHGRERHWGSDGHLEFETTYVNGLEHGLGPAVVAGKWPILNAMSG